MALNFSDSDKAKYMTGQYKKEIKLYFPQLSLTVLNEEIYGESLSLEEAIFDGNGELSIVGCISNRFSIEIRNQGVQLKNKTIQVSIRIDNGSWNQIFTGYVDSVETVRDRSYQKLQCYDALYKYQDKNFFNTYDGLAFPVTIKTLRDALFTFIGVTQETITLVNDTVSIEQTIEDGELAVIDVIRAICQMNGVFGKMGADGKFHYMDIKVPSEFLPYPSDELFPGADLYPSDSTQETVYIDKYRNITYEDYEVAQITGVTVRDGTSDIESGTAGEDDNILLIEGNIWCNGLEQATKEDIAQNILDKVGTCVYTPFEAVTVGLPYIECGDAVAFYVYDYSSGEPVTDIMGFTVMSRYLKGIQWLTDTYNARGNEYQPEVIPVGSDDIGKQLDQMEQVISNIAETVEQQGIDIGNKQNYIDKDILEPSWDASEGDLCFWKNNPYRLYRYESGQWNLVRLYGWGQNAPTQGEEGDFYIQNNGSHIVGIWQMLNGVWCEYKAPYGHLVDYSTDEQDTEVEYLDGSHIFQRSFYLTTAVSLASNVWTNAVQNNLIGQVIDAEGANEDGDMIALIGRANNGYAQVMSLMSAAQSLKVLTLKYTKAAGAYDFNANYQQGNTYTFAPTIDAEEFIIWLVKHFISVCKSKGGTWTNAPIFTYVLNNLSTIVARFMEYRGNNNGIGVSLMSSINDNNYYRFWIYVTFTNGNKTARVAESYTAHGDASKYLWGNDSQSSLWATRGEYCYRLNMNKTTQEVYTEWALPEWAYTMYCRHLGIRYSSEDEGYISTYDVTNYGIHLT